MNLNLAAMYGTPGAQAVAEEQTKLAEAELFSKLAADNGIDLNQLNDDQLQELWNLTFSKTATGDEEKETAEHEASESKDEEAKEEKEEKKEAAAREHSIKLAHAEEEQRAHYLGQVMAHSYVAELSKIAAAREAEQGTETVVTDDGVKEAAMPPALAKALGKVKSVGGEVAGKAKSHGAAGVAKAKEFGAKGVAAAKSNPGKTLGGAAAVGAGAGFGAGRASKKEASATLDELALEEAVKMAHAAGLDAEQAAARVSAVFTLGLEESTKLASDVDSQINIRALEYLEAAGYPVTWAE